MKTRTGGHGLEAVRELDRVWGELNGLVSNCARASRVTEADEDRYSELLGQAQVLHGRLSGVLGVPVMEQFGRRFDAFQFVLAQPSLSRILGGAAPELGFWKELWTLAASAIRQARGRLEAEREGRALQDTAPPPRMVPEDAILDFLDSTRDEVVPDTAISAYVEMDVVLVQGYLDDLELGGFVNVSRSFGGYGALITPRGSVRVHERRTAAVHGGETTPLEGTAAGKTATAAGPELASPVQTGKEYFVAHEFSAEKRDDLRRAIEKALAGSGLRPYYADNEVREGHIFKDKILPKIHATRFGIYDLSNPEKPNVFMELGAAIGMGKPYFIICRQGTDLPSDVLGLDRIEYESYAHLTKELKAKIPKPSGGAP
jgi:hypothetical protein